MSESNEVSVIDNKALAEIGKKFGAVGAAESIEQNDIELKRLSLGQGVSDAVQDGKVNIGDYYNRQDDKVLGNAKKPAEFVIFYMNKVWMEFDLVWNEKKKQEDREFKQVVPVTADNANLEYLEKENKIARDFTYNFFMLSVEEMAEGMAIPYIFSLNRVQTRAAKAINQMTLKLKEHKAPSFAVVFNFSSEAKTKEDKKWQQVVVNMGRVTTDAEQQQADKWYKVLKSQEGNVKVAGDEKKEVKETKPADTGLEEDDLPF